MRKLTPLLIILATLVSGCSTTSFLYNNAPWLVRETIDDYFSITSEQERQLNRDIGAFFEWHRRYELPEYADLISSFEADLVDGLTGEEVEILFERLAAARVRFGEQGLASASAFLVSISDEQLQNFHDEVNQRLAEDREVFELTPARQDEKSFNRLLDIVEGWTGNLDQKQSQKLKEVNDARPRDYALWLNRREQRHRKLLEFLRDKPEQREIEAYLQNNYVLPSDTDWRDMRRRSIEYWTKLLFAIDRMITPEQRRKTLNRFAEYRRDFLQLSRQTVDKPDPSSEIER